MAVLRAVCTDVELHDFFAQARHWFLWKVIFVFDALTGRQAVESQRLQRTFLLIRLVPLASLFLFLPT